MTRNERPGHLQCFENHLLAVAIPLYALQHLIPIRRKLKLDVPFEVRNEQLIRRKNHALYPAGRKFLNSAEVVAMYNNGSGVGLRFLAPIENSFSWKELFSILHDRGYLPDYIS